MACSPCPTTPMNEPPTTPTTPTTHNHHHHHLPSSPTVASSPPLTTQPPASSLTSLCNMSSDSLSLPPQESGGFPSSSCTITNFSSSLGLTPDRHAMMPPPSDRQAVGGLASTGDKQSAADKQAALSSKLRLAKSLTANSTGGGSSLLAPKTSFSAFRASLMDDTNGSYSNTSEGNSYAALLGSLHKASSSTMSSSSSLYSSQMDITAVGVGVRGGNASSSGSFRQHHLADDSDIHVMSPSLVNSQVLANTRPLSPPPPSNVSSSSSQSLHHHNHIGSHHQQHTPSHSPHMSQHIGFQPHHYLRPMRHDVGGVRETLDSSGLAGGQPPSSPQLDPHLRFHHFQTPTTDRGPLDRKPPQRGSWSRRRPPSSASAALEERRVALKGGLRETLDSDDSMASLKSLEGSDQSLPPPLGASGVPPQDEGKAGTKGRGGRGKRRARLFKLKFHHQALPPEYLDHYEASLRQEQKRPPPPPPPPAPPVPSDKGAAAAPPSSQSRNKGRGSRGGSKTPRPITIHEAGSGATEALLRELLMSRPHLQQAALQQAALARAQSVPSIMMATKHGMRANLGSSTPSPVPSIAEEASTQENEEIPSDAKSKKGRRNRKSDVSTMVARGLGRDNSGNLLTAGNMTAALGAQSAILEQEAMSRSRSYTSLLRAALADQSEPLNLCVRDTPLKLEEETYISPRVKEEPPNNYSEILRSPSANIRSPDVIMRRSSDSRTPMSPPLEYGPWATLAHHPQWMHDYRLKTEDGLSSGQSTPSLCSQSSHLPPISPPVWPHFSPPPLGSPHPHSPSPSPMTPPHRNVHALLKESLHLRHEEAARERLTPHDSYMPSPDRMSTGTPVPPHLPQVVRSPSRGGVRKKRSAVYMPTPDPNSEVSICKFKFTGGANPMLEEKKMVSVDSAGTMRYFTGGERGTIRDHRAGASQLRLSGKLLGNISKSEKDNKKIRLESHESTENSLMSQSSSSLAESPAGSLEPSQDSRQQLNQVEDSPKRKRRSKKASVRERFEQTLRERGLLIQTQQVESAEGATYCKFRQLRKITRYLFRSWKDYLPGQLPEDLQDGQTCPTPHLGPAEHPGFAASPR